MYFYFIHYNVFNDHFKYRELNPTGKWKLEYVPYSSYSKVIRPSLFIEHKGLIFKKWVIEYDIIEVSYKLSTTEYS